MGTFNGNVSLTSLLDCIPCPKNSYNNKTAQITCKPCGSSAIATNDSLSCLCRGLNRQYHASDGQCRCLPGHRVYSANVTSDADAVVDCEPVILDRCATGAVRSSDGTCVSLSSTCNISCADGFIPKSDSISLDGGVGDVGLCSCVCDPKNSSCVSNQLTRQTQSLSLEADSNGVPRMTVYDSVTKSFKNFSLADAGVSGDFSCSSPPCNFQIIQSSSAGFGGVVEAGPSYLAALSSNRSGTSSRRLLQASTDSVINSPVVCIKAGSGILFDITTDSSGTHYPQYDRDSLLNTNPSFDFGRFIELRDQISSGSAPRAFYFSFSSPGIYAFSDVVTPSRQTIVGVVDPVLQCPPAFATNAIQPLSAKILQQFPGVRSTGSVTLAPDFGLVIGLSVGLGCLILFLVGLILYIRRRRAKALNEVFSAEKDLKPSQLHKFIATGNTTKISSGIDGVFDLEGFSVDTLMDILRDQSSRLQGEMKRQNDDIRALLRNVHLSSLENAQYPHTGGNHTLDAVQSIAVPAVILKSDVDAEVARRKAVAEAGLKIAAAESSGASRVRRAFEELFVVAAAAISDMSFESASALSSLLDGMERRDGDLFASSGVSLLLDGQHADVLDGDGIPRIIDGLTEPHFQVPGLVVPVNGARVAVMAGTDMSIVVPDDFFVCSKSGLVSPIAGGVFIDVDTRQVSDVESIQFERFKRCLPLIENRQDSTGDFFPSSTLAFAHLCKAEDLLNLPETILCPSSGLEVPTLAVTFSPMLNGFIAVGGSMIDPITRLCVPIRLGYPMQDPANAIVPILGVAIDVTTGVVVPVGRTVNGSPAHRFRPTADSFSGVQVLTQIAVPAGGFVHLPASPVAKAFRFVRDLAASLHDKVI